MSFGFSVLKYSRVTWVKCKIIFHLDCPIRLATAKNVISFPEKWCGVGGMENKHELCFCCCCNPNSFATNGQVPRATVRGGENVCEKSRWSSHGSISRWCEGCEMIWREKKNVRGNLKLSMETIFRESAEIESSFLGMVNRVVCDEIEFPLSSARNKGSKRARRGGGL